MVCLSRVVIALFFCLSLSSSMSIAAITAASDMSTRSGAVMEVPIVQPNAYGTTDQTSVFVHSTSLKCWDSSVLIDIDGFGYGSTSAACDAIVGFAQMPMGAALNSIELEAYDSSDTAGIEYNLYACLKNAAGCTNLATATTGAANMPGYGLFPQNTVAHTVRNDQYDYFVVLRETDASPVTSWSGVKVYYTLQISPAPGTATFSDVPTDHPFFQHIEALAASGITTGYGDGTFRPGNYVTRQAMAAFLARALGLHWPN